MAIIYRLDRQAMADADQFFKAEMINHHLAEPDYHRLIGIYGEMLATAYFESRVKDNAAVIPVGLAARAGICSQSAYSAGDVLVVPRSGAGSVRRYEVKATKSPERIYSIPQYDAEKYYSQGVDQVIFVFMAVGQNEVEGEIYARVSPREILEDWKRVKVNGEDRLHNPDGKIGRFGQRYAAEWLRDSGDSTNC